MFYKNSQNREVQSIFFFPTVENRRPAEPILLAELGELQGLLAQSLSVDICVWP